ncbi:hypothetical protein [Owenweeksia hongkongensis]|uniref:hypothetical protein n=1 Tax=Owenweeksia hongkongensis TaxID=253245 RepID=UPI003A9343BF
MKVIFAIGAFLLAEILAIIVFKILRKQYVKSQNSDSETDQHRFLGMKAPIFKGVLERLTIFIGLLGGFPQILIVFGALKIATRIQSQDSITNDYFLIGNFSSISISMGTYYLYEWACSLQIAL